MKSTYYNILSINRMDIYTPEDIAIKLINTINFIPYSTVLDCCSGINKVFYNNFPINCIRYYCEIEEDIDFFNFNTPIEYIVSNPPFARKLLWKFINHAMDICTREIYFLINVDCLNVFTKNRYGMMKDKGFNIASIKFIEIPKWYGRYIFICISKNHNGLIDFLGI